MASEPVVVAGWEDVDPTAVGVFRINRPDGYWELRQERNERGFTKATIRFIMKTRQGTGIRAVVPRPLNG